MKITPMSTNTTKNVRNHKIKTHVTNGFAIEFDNGNQLSVMWGTGSYSDNHDWSANTGNPVDDYETRIPTWTTTVEIMPTCSEKTLKKLERKFPENANGSVFGRLKVSDLFEVIKILETNR